MTATVTILSDDFIREMRQQGVINHENVLDVDVTKKMFEAIRAMGVAEGRASQHEVLAEGIGDLLEALGVSPPDSFTQALEKISALRNHAKCADETLARVRGEHDLAKRRVESLRTEIDTQRRKNDEAHIEIKTLQRLLSERGSPLSPPVTEAEAALLRLVRQYGCIDERGEIDTVRIQLALDFLKASEAAAKGHRDGVVATALEAQVQGLRYRAEHESDLARIQALREEREIDLARIRELQAGHHVEPTAFDLSLKRLLERAAVGPSGKKIVDECFRLAEMLVEKNIAYGDSALNPVRIFARDLEPRAQILVRLDDKLSRLARGSAAGEDVFLDLIGYLVLYRIAEANAAAAEPAVNPAKAVSHLDFLDLRLLRDPTPEEVAQMRETAAESEKNSPYQEFKGFVECQGCRDRRATAWKPTEIK